MFSKIFTELNALFIWMFFSGDLVTTETLADFQNFLSKYGYSLHFQDNQIIFDGKIITPLQSRIQILSYSKAVLYPQMGEAIEIQFKRGKMTTTYNAA